MNAFYFGAMNQYVEAGYAPTDRAKCKLCKIKIQKDSLRMGIIQDDDHFSGKNYYHLDCLILPPRFKELDPETQIYNLDQLEEDDANQVLRHIKDQVKSLKEGKVKKKSAIIMAKKTQYEQKQKAKHTSRSKSKSSNTNKSKSKNKDNKKQISYDQKQVSKSQQKRRAKSIRNTRSKSKAKVSVSKDQKQVAPIKTKAKKKIKKPINQGYTKEQLSKFKQLVDEYMRYSADRLKSILAANNQSRVGNKQQLSQKCADGKILGKIPMCSSCGGGKLRFNRMTGIYTCPGYMDDDEFRNCHKNYTMSEIIRDQWVQP